MLSPKTKYSLINAKQYFEEHLCAGDYYSESERVLGQWLGKGAELLGLSGRVPHHFTLSTHLLAILLAVLPIQIRQSFCVCL